MIIHKNLRLCGGTLFFLLLKANENCEASQDLRFKYFLKVIDPQAVENLLDGEVDRLHTYASNFRNCRKVPMGKYTRLGNANVCAFFKDEIKEDAMAGITRVKDFCDKYVPDTSRPWLVRALLELIESDESIGDNAIFYMKPGFAPMYKSELLEENTEISFYDFLLGAWFYVYENCEDNTIGARTIDSLTSHVKGNVESLFSTGSIGHSDRFQDVSISYEISDNTEDDEDEEENQTKMGVFLLDGDIAPDLGKFDPESELVYISAEKANTPSKDIFAKYRDVAYKKHSRKRSFIYDTERPFRDFYVCNDIAPRVALGFVERRIELAKEYNTSHAISDISICKFRGLKNLIVGQGGLGKTMMMYHLFLRTIDDYERDPYLPVFVSLNDYIPEKKDLLFLINEAITRYDKNLQLSDVVKKLEEGENVILLDGFDEIPKAYLNAFIKELDIFGDTYLENAIIVSSRNMPENRRLTGYQIYDLLPFSESQAFEMISKLDPLYVEDSLKERFIRAIKQKRFRFNEQEKREFFGNPLFLTIMLITYNETNDIQPKRYMFYEQAYRAMATRHDAIKGVTREFFTKFDERDFKKYFGQFCLDSYADHTLKFTRDEMDEYLQHVIDDNDLQTDVDAFYKDLLEKLCLMYFDGSHYRFIHRSFQEYFAAYFCTTLMDEEYRDVYDVLMDLDDKIVSDETIPMLYGLNDKKCEKYIIIPFIESIVTYDESKEAIDYDDEYMDFILRFYPTVEYVTGELDEEMATNELKSALYKFIAENYGIKRDVEYYDFEDEGWADESDLFYFIEDYRYNHEWGDTLIENSLWKYTDDDGNPYEGVEIKEAGYVCSIDMHKAASPSKLINDVRWGYFNSSDFPLREEFDELVKLLGTLKTKYKDGVKKKRRFGLGK